MRQIVGFLMQMEARRWRVLLVGLLLLAGITVLFAVGKQQFAQVEGDLERWRGPAARMLDRLGGEKTARLKGLVGRNAFSGSFIIRNVPSAPFIVVNAAFGAVRANYWGYLAGCALGVLPKTAMVAFFGGSFMTAVKGDGVWSSLVLAALAFAWLGIMLGAREIIRRRNDRLPL